MSESTLQRLPRLTSRELFEVFMRAEAERWTELYVIGPSFEGVPDSDVIADYLTLVGEDRLADRVFRLAEGQAAEFPSGSWLSRLKVMAWIGLGLCSDDAARLAGLTNVNSLNLRNNSIGPSGAAYLEELTQLTWLNLRGNRIRPEGAAHLAGLKNLTTLKLSDNELVSTGTLHLAGLTKLIALNLSQNRIASEGIAPLVEMTNLAALDLSHNWLHSEDVKHLAGLKKLTSLNLSHNAIESCNRAHFASLTDLKTLNLSCNLIRPDSAECLAELRNLNSLSLYGNEFDLEGLKILANAWRCGKLPHLDHLNVNDNIITSIDLSVLATQDARLIFETLFGGKVSPHARVMFVGMGEVGKSSIARRCFTDTLVGKQDPHSETHDIELIRSEDCTWKPWLQTSDGHRRIETRVWDFAGQLVTHGLHEAFLESDGRTIYVLTLAADRVPDRQVGASTEVKSNRLPYWLRMLRYYAGEKVPVVLAITRCDVAPEGRRKIDQPLTGIPAWKGRCVAQLEPALLKDSHDVCVTRIVDGCSAQNRDYPIEPLRDAIQTAIGQLCALRDGRVPPELLALKSEVERKLQGRTVVPLTEYYGWCDEVGVKDSDRLSLLEIIHYMGSAIHFGHRNRSRDSEFGLHRVRHAYLSSMLKNHILNPRWFKWCVYEITRESERSIPERRDGWFRVEQIERVITEAGRHFLERESRPDGSEIGQIDDAAVVRDALVYVRLCWHDQSGEHYLFPRGLKSFTPLGSDNWPKTELIWTFLPEANFARLIVELHEANFVVNQDGDYLHGRNCVVIEYPPASGTRAALVSYPDDGKIEIRFAPGGQTEDWPRLLQAVLDLMQHRIQGQPTINQPTIPHTGTGAIDQDLNRSSKRPGRGRRADPEQIKNDANVWEAWRSGQYPTYAELARALKSFSTGPQAHKILTARDIELAIGRHKKHRKKPADQ